MVVFLIFGRGGVGNNGWYRLEGEIWLFWDFLGVFVVCYILGGIGGFFGFGNRVEERF